MRVGASVSDRLPRAAAVAVLATAIGSAFLLLSPPASSTTAGPALKPGFLPGLWCGAGKAPVGKEITIKGRRLTFVGGKLEFILTSAANGDAFGELNADIRSHYEDRSSKQIVEAEFRYVGEFDIKGTNREPKLVGTWKVSGVFLVTIKGQTKSFPYKATHKAKSWLDIDSASLDLVLGSWAGSKWKWKATRPKADEDAVKC